MLFFKEKEAMGLEASLKLLDLSPEATIDDANQAYACLHRMIDRFHRDAGNGSRGDRQEDLDLLTCAYEKAVAHISEHDSRPAPPVPSAPDRSAVGDICPSTDLHFTINFSPETVPDGVQPPPGPQAHPIEEAVAIISRRLHEVESALPDAQQAVESAVAAVEAAKLRHDRARQATMMAFVTAKSAKTRALLLEIDAKRAMEDAIAVAEKARDRVAAARQSAREARAEADNARQQANRISKSEETTAAEAICAEDRLEKAKDRLKGLTHNLLETRNRMKLFRDAPAMLEMHDPAVKHLPATIPDNRFDDPLSVDRESPAREQIMSDLLEIEAALNARKCDPTPSTVEADVWPGAAEGTVERRQHHRIVYPTDLRPLLSLGDHSISVLDLSAAGMRLEPDADVARLRIVRGILDVDGRLSVKVTGKVVRQDGSGLGVRLVTRIGNHILDQERLRVSA